MRKFKFEKGLRPLKAKPVKKKIFGFDIETSHNNKRFVCATIYSKEYQMTFYSKEELLKELTTNRVFRGAYICATNLMFDFYGLFPIEEAFEMFKIIERGSGLVFASARVIYKKPGKFYSHHHVKAMLEKGKIKDIGKDTYKVTFIDTGNHLKTTLKTLGKIVKQPKMEPPDCLGNRPKNKKEWKELVDYNVNDARVTYMFMMFLQDTYNDLGAALKVTVSSTAIDYFRRKFLKEVWPQEDRKKINLCYQAYYGGRTEAFHRGIFDSDNYGVIKSYDVNSLYPFCLKQFKYPYPKTSEMKGKLSCNDPEDFEGVGYFTMKAPDDMHIPVLPVKTDKLRFPVGTFTGCYDFNSIRLALNNGYEIEKIYGGLVYEHTFKPFIDMIEKLYNLRKSLKSAQNPAEKGAKLIMNSFYGKFAYNYANKEMLGNVDDVLSVLGTSAQIFPTGSKKIFRIRTTQNSKIPNYVFPIYPLYVTSYARQTMFNLFKKIGVKNVLYSDTDCIFTTKNVNTSNELGDLKLENAFKELIIVKPKFYSGKTIEGKDLIKVKGVFKAVKDYEHFKALIQKRHFHATMLQFRKLRGAIGRSDRYVNETYYMKKVLSLEDNKRLWPTAQYSETPQISKPFKI